ncbi:hypothetical protein BDF22DRAFT_756544 [Syncephalis plumigaleata]|nr:hypothetical protein BDF22DRAFT_756544 [Syncephalis plumigaleata]
MRPNEFRGARSTLNSATLATPLLEQLHRELLRATGNASDDDDIQMDNGSGITLTSDDENGDDDNNDKMDTDEEIDIDVEVIDPEWTAHNATLGNSTTATDPLEHLATWSVMATMPQVTSSPMAIDWIWRVIGELHMPTYLPSALVPSRKGRHQYNRREISGGNGKEERAGRLALVRAFADTTKEQKEEQHGTSQRLALRQQASVGGVLLLGVRAFLKHILHEANQQRTLGESTEQASNSDKKAMLLPFHVYKALYQSSDQFDFLTQRHLESSNPNQNNSNGNIIGDLTQTTPTTTTDATVESTSSLEEKLNTLLTSLDKNTSANISSVNEENKTPTATHTNNNQDKQETLPVSDHNITESAQVVAYQLHSLHNNLLQQTQKARNELATQLDHRKVDADTLLDELTRTSHC